MQKNEMVEKRIVLWDGEEIPGLVGMGGISREKTGVEVPSFGKVITVPDGIRRIPVISFTYKINRDTNTLQFFEEFFTNNEVKSATIIRTDAHGVEFARILTPFSEARMIEMPEIDLLSPPFAQIAFEVTPWDIVYLAAA